MPESEWSTINFIRRVLFVSMSGHVQLLHEEIQNINVLNQEKQFKETLKIQMLWKKKKTNQAEPPENTSPFLENVYNEKFSPEN